MARLDEAVLGYHKGCVKSSDTCKLVNTFLKAGVCTSVSPGGEFTLRRRDKDCFLRCAKGRIRFELGEPYGIYGFILRNRNRYGFFLALILLAVFSLFSYSRIWDVRVSGNSNLSDYTVQESLAKCGFCIGSGWSSVDKNEVEAQLLSDNPNIAWISINRRGTVAYVEVIESENIGIDEGAGYICSNIVADRDGVIEEIAVESGIAAVKVGDVVTAGQILISGVVENESGVRFCRAVGSVRASGAVDISAEATDRYAVKKSVKTRLAQARLVIFNFSINIFKNYGNRQNNYDIIEETRKFALFDKYKLPIRVEKNYIREYSEELINRSADEMTKAAREELDGKIYSTFKNADIIKLKTKGEFLSGKYRLTSRVVYSAEIGKESEVKIN